MMKDQSIIEQVIIAQKSTTAKVFLKFYELLKSIRREKGSLQTSKKSEYNSAKPGKGFIDLIVALCRDSFNLVGSGEGYLDS